MTRMSTATKGLEASAGRHDALTEVTRQWPLAGPQLRWLAPPAVQMRHRAQGLYGQITGRVRWIPRLADRDGAGGTEKNDRLMSCAALDADLL